MGKRNRQRRPADPRSKTMTRETELRNSLITHISQHHKEVNFLLASVKDHWPNQPNRRFRPHWPSAVRAAGAHASQPVGFRGRQRFKGPPSVRLSSLRPRRGTAGPAFSDAYKRPDAGISERRSNRASAGPQARQPYAWRAFEAPAASKPHRLRRMSARRPDCARPVRPEAPVGLIRPMVLDGSQQEIDFLMML